MKRNMTQDLFVKLFKSLAPGRAAGGKVELNRYKKLILSLACSACLWIQPALGEDLREVRIETRQIEAAMAQKAADELRAAKEAEAETQRAITEDREKLARAIAERKQKKQKLEIRLQTATAENEALAQTDAELSEKLSESQGVVRELTGVIRLNAKDIGSLADSSVLAGVYRPDTAFLKAIAEKSVFPGMGHIRNMADLIFDQIRKGGAVSIETVPIVNRSGKTVESQVLVLGCFTAAYRLAEETGFLNYAPGERTLYALSRTPSGGMQKGINRYMDGHREAVPLDISRGGALRQITHELSLWEQIPAGGPIVWPILAILAVGGLISLERLVFLLRSKLNLDPVCADIESLAEARNWEACLEICDRYAKSPVIRVVKAGLGSRELPREEMESAVQEAILREIPPMERFLSTLGMLAAIAPLLGLLGTVTGMIGTFHVITMHGTGDPRLMSGGISEALVTTMLGLSVAIPIMLAHTLLSRSVENTVGLMEEKAVALINTVQRTQAA